MSVLVEALSVVRLAAINRCYYAGGWHAFLKANPNRTFCAAEAFVKAVEARTMGGGAWGDPATCLFQFADNVKAWRAPLDALLINPEDPINRTTRDNYFPDMGGEHAQWLRTIICK